MADAALGATALPAPRPLRPRKVLLYLSDEEMDGLRRLAKSRREPAGRTAAILVAAAVEAHAPAAEAGP
jgi:hypothetical protein